MIYTCAKCGKEDNSATSAYWTLTHMPDDLTYDDSLLEYKGKPLCSRCATLRFEGEKCYVIPRGNS